jgi:RNA recognition motif-containing protein
MYDEEAAPPPRSKSSYDEPEDPVRPDGFRVYVGNVNFDADDRVLDDAFRKFGTVTKTHVRKSALAKTVSWQPFCCGRLTSWWLNSTEPRL